MKEPNLGTMKLDGWIKIDLNGDFYEDHRLRLKREARNLRRAIKGKKLHYIDMNHRITRSTTDNKQERQEYARRELLVRLLSENLDGILPVTKRELYVASQHLFRCYRSLDGGIPGRDSFWHFLILFEESMKVDDWDVGVDVDEPELFFGNFRYINPTGRLVTVEENCPIGDYSGKTMPYLPKGCGPNDFVVLINCPEETELLIAGRIEIYDRLCRYYKGRNKIIVNAGGSASESIQRFLYCVTARYQKIKQRGFFDWDGGAFELFLQVRLPDLEVRKGLYVSPMPRICWSGIWLDETLEDVIKSYWEKELTQREIKRYQLLLQRFKRQYGDHHELTEMVEMRLENPCKRKAILPSRLIEFKLI